MAFKFRKTKIPDLLIIERQSITDKRGSFRENYKLSEFRKAGIKDVFIQDNQSISHRNVLRGLHFQRPPFAQAKLVSCLRGAIMDVAVDIRPKSATYKQHVTVDLRGDDDLMLYIPAGFAHGFYSRVDGSVLSYKCSAEYSPAHDAGVRWDDPRLAIKWPTTCPRMSAKDVSLPFLK